jgi:hypothetical protein
MVKISQFEQKLGDSRDLHVSGRSLMQFKTTNMKLSF